MSRLTLYKRVAVSAVIVSVLTISAPAALVEMVVCGLDTTNPGDLSQLRPGDLIEFWVGVRVDPDFGGPSANVGAATVIYDLRCPETEAGGYLLLGMEDARAGYSEDAPQISDPLYIASTPCPGCFGGWGFDSGGMPTGGDLTSIPGAILGASVMAPMFWVADVNPLCSGLQPNALQGVGHEPYVFPPDDPQQLGCPDNWDAGGEPVPPGDGTWIIQYGLLDTTGWAPQTYHFTVSPTSVALYDASVDYTHDQFGGFLMNVAPADMQAAAFSLTLGRPGDVDGDGDVDLTDFATFALCFTNGATTPPPGCSQSEFDACDLDDDSDVDLNDFATFALNFTG